MHDRILAINQGWFLALLKTDPMARRADEARRYGRERNYSVDMEIASNPWEMIQH
jgi:hypothetical protein